MHISVADADRPITDGLNSDLHLDIGNWPCITDNSGISTCGLAACVREISIRLHFSQSRSLYIHNFRSRATYSPEIFVHVDEEHRFCRSDFKGQVCILWFKFCNILSFNGHFPSEPGLASVY